MKVKCPHCGKETETEGNSFRPFCSERCKLLDLGDWLSGAYSIPGTGASDEDNDASAPERDSDEK